MTVYSVLLCVNAILFHFLLMRWIKDKRYALSTTVTFLSTSPPAFSYSSSAHDRACRVYSVSLRVDALLFQFLITASAQK